MMNKYQLTLVFLLLSISIFGQPPAPPATPIDGGLGILLGGGLLYGISRIKNPKK